MFDKLNDLIDKGVLEARKKEKPRDYLGASSMGEECLRKLKYQIMGVPKEKDFTPRTLRIFETGHMFEELAIKWIRQAGIKLETHDKDGNQFGFSQLDGRFKGHIDGKIHLDGVRLWECKSMNNSSFNATVKHGVKKQHFGYYVQVQLYMAFNELTDRPAILTAVNKNNCELAHFEIAFDRNIAQKYSDRAWYLFDSMDNRYWYDAFYPVFPREHPFKNWFKCNLCPYQERCWKE